MAEGEPVCTDPQEPTPAHTPRLKPTDLFADSPSDSLPLMLSDSPSLVPSNLSVNATSNSSSQLPSDGPAAPPSETPANTSSDLLPDPTVSHPPPSAPASTDPATNSSELVSVGPSLEPQRDAGLWSSTVLSTVDTQAEHNTEADVDESQ